MRRFIADTHFDHEKLVMNFPRFIPGTQTLFASIKDHDDYLLNEINESITDPDNDELFILGDFAWNKPGKYRMAIKYKHVYLIRGNHDQPQACRNVFGEIPYVRHTKVRTVRNGHKESLNVVLCHTPMAFWEGSHRGWGHLYGHTHGQREETMSKGLGWLRRSFDVGVDNLAKRFGSFKPIDERSVFYIFDAVPGHDDPSYYDNNLWQQDADHGEPDEHRE
jgi:calcineurin-like phosphoesterase family protein